MLQIWDLAAITAKVSLYLGVFASTGTVFCALLFQFRHTKNLTFGFAALGIVSTLLSFFIGGASLTGDFSGMTDPEILGILWSTPVGSTSAYRIAGLCILVLGLFLGRFGGWLSAIGGLIALASFTQIGHIHDIQSYWASIALGTHLIAIALWIGILMPLRRLSLQTTSQSEAVRVAQKFGQFAIVFVPVLVLAGGYMAYRLVGNIANLTATSYGQTLILKIVLVSTLLGLAALNKYRYVPRLRQGNLSAGKDLARSIQAESAVILAILVATTVLTTVLSLP